MIRGGRVSVDGRNAVIGEKVDPEQVVVHIDGIRLPVQPGLETWLLYKPRGAISTASDPAGRPIVVDLVDSAARLYPVGRLDADSEGLLLLTNDGDLANLVTHPRYGVRKTYVALIDGLPKRASVQRLVDGVILEDGPAHAVSARIIDSEGDRSLVEVVMAEGRKREVRRMLAAIGHECINLARTSIGPIVDRDLTPGTARRLAVEEIRALYLAAGETWDDATAAQDDV